MRAGFTLIELLIVSAIILVLASFSTPLFRRQFADLELKETASNISRFIAFAQQKAIIDRCVYRLRFDFEAKTYQLTRMISEGQNINYANLKDRFGRIFYIPKGIDIKGLSQEILFYPDGHSEPSIVDLKLMNKNKHGLTITTRGTLGNAIVTEDKE